MAIENARLYETIKANELRMERELLFAKRVQAALLPAGLPKRQRGVDVAARFESARELGGDLHDFLSPEANSLVVTVGDVWARASLRRCTARLRASWCAPGTFRRRDTPERSTPAAVLGSVNTILHERGLEEYDCTLCYAFFDFKRRAVLLANSGLPYPIRCRVTAARQVELPGMPLGLFAGATYDEIAFDLAAGDLFVFCSDGVFEAFAPDGQEFGAERLLGVVAAHRQHFDEGAVAIPRVRVRETRGRARRRPAPLAQDGRPQPCHVSPAHAVPRAGAHEADDLVFAERLRAHHDGREAALGRHLDHAAGGDTGGVGPTPR